MIYNTILELRDAIKSGEVKLDEIAAFDNKGELFINDANGKHLFIAYYRSHNACDDICALLGIDEIESV